MHSEVHFNFDYIFNAHSDMTFTWWFITFQMQLVSVVSFEREAKSKQEKNAEIKKVTAEIGTIKRWH